MVKTNKPGAVAGLQDLLSTLPTDQDARSDFFRSWKDRAITTLELVFQDDPQPVQQFKEIEFSPRRLSNDEVRDAQLKLDAYLAGCAAARTLLESLLWRLSSADKTAAPDAAPAPLLTVARAAAAPEPAAPKPRPKPLPQPAMTYAPSTDPWVIRNPDHAMEPEQSHKPLMSADVVLLPPNPVQVEAALRREQEKAAKEKAQREKAERERVEREKAEKEQAAREQAAREQAQREQAEREKAEHEKAEREKAKRAKAERERIEREKAEEAEAEEAAQREAHRRSVKQQEHRHGAEREKAHRTKGRRHPQSDESVIAGASMDTRDLSSPVRTSLARMLGAWDKGDRDAAAVVSAQLLADLSVLAHHDQFQEAFETVVNRAFAPDEARKAVEMLKSSAPLCVWSMIAAINEVMKD